jgi:hypothetical protein
VANNVLEDQGSWGILTSDNADPEQPPPGAHCQGGIWNYPLHGFCLFRARGNQIISNVSSHVGSPKTSTSMSPTGRWPACPSCRAAQDP